MPKVWLDVGSLLASPTGSEPRTLQAECIRLALAFEPGYFAFCRLDGSGFHMIEPASVQGDLESLSAPPRPVPASAAPGIRQRAKHLIGRLPVPLQAPAMALGRAGARLLPGSGSGPVPAIQAVPAPPLPEPPFGAGDVYVSLSCIAAAGQQLLDDLNEKLSVTMLAVDAHDSAADIVQRALVVASQGGAGFEERLQHLYTSLLQVGDLCIDIGAHTGRHSLPMSRVVGTTGRVVAFEPNPAIAQRLRARLKLLSVGNVAVRETALSDEEGTAEFVIAVDLPEESGLRQRTIYNGPTRTETVTVQLARLDGLHLESPRFIKLDTEGAEYKVLVGARDTLARWRPVVAFEFGQASYAAYDVDPDDMFDYFASLDYEVFSILGDRLTKPQFAEASRVQRYWDYVACDRGASARIAAILQGFG
jgi:FkbM family methyltransferase